MLSHLTEGLCVITDTISISIAADAAAHVAALGLQTDFERMLNHAQATIPGLQKLDATLAEPYDTGEEMTVLLRALRDPASRASNDHARRDWSSWKINTFSPDVHRHFALLIAYGGNHA